MKSPAFRFYPSDFWGSPDVQAMELHEVGAYVALLSTAWQAERHGYLPDDESRLRRWARMSVDQWNVSRDYLLKKFPVVEPGWRANPRMVEEAERQADFSASQTAKANKRWAKDVAMPNVSRKDAVAYSGASIPDAGGMPSVSVSVSQKQIQGQEPAALSFVSDSEQKQTNKKSRRFDDAEIESIWNMWPNRNGKREGLQSIEKALSHLAALGVNDPLGNLKARVGTFLAWHARQTASGAFTPAIGFAQGWFGDRQRRYLDPTAEPPAETLLLIDGKPVPQSACEADGWVVMRGDV